MRRGGIARRLPAGLFVALAIGASGVVAGCGTLSITERCHRAHPRGTEGYRECVRAEQAEAERIRSRSTRQFPTHNLP